MPRSGVAHINLCTGQAISSHPTPDCKIDAQQQRRAPAASPSHMETVPPRPVGAAMWHDGTHFAS